MSATDPYNLQRFVEAQEPVYGRVCDELRAGRKTSHWIWFIFPQIAGLGYSPMAQRFAISGREEAVGYLQHPVLGPRLTECTRLVNAHAGHDIVDILGDIDAIKFRSSMTLFAKVAKENQIFLKALQTFCQSEMDELTLGRL
ncbi:MAG TPA: DUF1810 domain-containing protein [Bradyrhizobium sp.]|nr:DUF1810 domain-containing protein [Bradyrhizobium sp.]